MTTTINNEHKKLNFSSEREQSQACLNSAEHEKNQGRKVLNVPNLRFPEFQGEWIMYKIKDVLSIGNGRDYKHLSNGEIPVFGTGGYMTSVDECLYDGETTFIGRKGSINKPFYYNGKFWTVDTLFYTHSFNGITPKFTYCLFQTIKWLKYNEASGVPSLSKDTIEKMKINIPGLEEQNKIAKLMFALDERIATQNKIMEDLKKLKCAIIEKVLNNSSCDKLQLGDVGSYIRGLTYSSNDVVECNGTLVMRSNNIVNGSSLDYTNNVVSVNKQISQEQQLQDGDIVICMANGSSALVGKSSFYDGKCSLPITVGAFCGIYRSKMPITKWLFQTNRYRIYIWNSLQGGNGAIANLNSEDILRMSFPLPDKQTVEHCTKLLSSLESLIESNVSLCSMFSQQKEYLLRQMFI